MMQLQINYEHKIMDNNSLLFCLTDFAYYFYLSCYANFIAIEITCDLLYDYYRNFNKKQMSYQTDPLESSHMCSIPIKFTEDVGAYTPMNSIEKQIIDDIKTSVGRIVKECRICLEGEVQGKMVAPCKCTGSVKYTHVKCLTQWLKRKIQADPKTKVKCELCEAEFNYRVTQNRIFDCEELKRNLTVHKTSIRNFAIVYIVFILVFFGIIGTLVYSSGESGQFLKKIIMPNSTVSVIIVTFLVLYGIVLIIIGVLFISEYVVRQELEINHVQNYSERPYFAKNYKIYFRR